MNLAILGTGTMAAVLGAAWRAAGHHITIAGRDPGKATALAERLGPDVRAAAPIDAVKGSEAVLLAVRPGGVEELLSLAGGPEGALDGTVLIDCTNTFEYPSGRRDPAQPSAAERAAATACGSRVVKALTLFAGESWLETAPHGARPRTVVMCGDDPEALKVAAGLVRDLGGAPAVLGGLDRAGQIEEVGGFVVGLIAKGADPTTAVPAFEVTAGGDRGVVR
jgi:predicted dinucleotide-binding enzyme